MTYVCKHCKSPVNSFTHFCNHCGQRVDVIDPDSIPQSISPSVQPVLKKIKKQNKKKKQSKRTQKHKNEKEQPATSNKPIRKGPHYSCNTCHAVFVNKSKCISHIAKHHTQLYIQNNNSYHGLYTLNGIHASNHKKRKNSK